MRIVSTKLSCVIFASALFFTVFMGLVSVADNEPEPLSNYTHTVFVEEFTTTSCSHCPSVGEALNNLYISGGYEFYFASLITNKVDASNQRGGEYNIGFVPTTMLDGGYICEVGSSDDVQTEEQRYSEDIDECGVREVEHEIQIDIEGYDIGAPVIQGNITVTNLQTQDYGGRLMVSIVEIVSRYLNYDNNPYHFGLLDFLIDQDISIPGSETYETSATWNGSEHQDLDGADFGDIDPNNIMLIAAVFNDQPHAASQPSTPPIPYTAYYVDQSAATTLIPPPHYGVELTPPTQTHTISAGGSTIYSINIENTGNTEDTYTMTISGEHSDWGTLSEGWPTLPPGSSQEISLEVSVPPGTADGSYDINVTATSDNDPSKTSTVNTTTVVSSVVTFGVNLYSAQTTKTTHPDESVIYTITVENTGNTDDTIDLSKSGTYSSWGTLSKSYVSLSTGGNEDITLTVNVPSDASGDDYPIDVKGTSQGNPSIYDEITLTTAVEQYTYGVDLDPEYQEDSVEVGDSVQFVITLTNTGNTEEGIDLTIHGNNEDWATLSYYSVNLDAGMDLDLVFTVDVPESAQPGDNDFTIKAVYEDDPGVFDEVEVSITVTEPNIITITDVTHSPSNPTENDEITVTATVTGDNINSVKLEYCKSDVCFTPESMQSIGSDQYSVTFGPLDVGDYEYEVRATDNSGFLFKSGKYTLTVSQVQPSQNDTDGDGYSDDVDAFPSDPDEWIDSDNDGVGDNSDEFPNDPSRWTSSPKGEAPWYESENARYMIMLLIIAIVVCAVLAGVFVRPGRKAKQPTISEMAQEPAQQPLPEAMAEPVFTPITEPQLEDISCPGCFTVFGIPLEPRPVQVRCPNCSLKGIID